MKMRSSNPVLKTVRDKSRVSDRPVTYANVTYKTVFLVAVTGLVGMYVFQSIATGFDIMNSLLIGALIVGFISVMVGVRSVRLSPYFAFIYAVSEGIVLGAISKMFAYYYEGIVPTAITTTFIVLLVMLLLYSSGVIKVTHKFASFMVVALISVIIMSLLSLFIPFSGPFYYLVVGISAVLAALFLLLDFEMIKNSVEHGMDHRYGWILSLGLMVTLVWVYIEVLRLLAIFASNRS